MKSSYKICIVIIVMLVILGVSTFLTNKKLKETNNQIDSVTSKEETNITWTGKYENKVESTNTYHDASVEFTNQTNDTIEFKMEAVHGMDIDHINMGEVSGKAKKVTEKNTYIFEDNVDGKIYKITFIFNLEDQSKSVEVKQNFPENFNPYAGHNVTFEGKYEKTK